MATAKPAKSAKSSKPAAKPAPKKEEKKAAPKASSSKTYMLSYRKEDKKWLIKIKGGEKPIKLFKTKAEAEEYLEEMADNQGASVSIKKRDGKFQKKH